jgi:hypothetical protein
MELSLTRQDIVQVGSTSAQNTMRLLPPSKKKKVRFQFSFSIGPV